MSLGVGGWRTLISDHLDTFMVTGDHLRPVDTYFSADPVTARVGSHFNQQIDRNVITFPYSDSGIGKEGVISDSGIGKEGVMWPESTM